MRQSSFEKKHCRQTLQDSALNFLVSPSWVLQSFDEEGCSIQQLPRTKANKLKAWNIKHQATRS